MILTILSSVYLRNVTDDVDITDKIKATKNSYNDSVI